MKKLLIAILSLAMILFASCASKPKNQSQEKMSITRAFIETYPEGTESLDLTPALKKLGIDINKAISDSDLSIINYILKNTYEICIHQMRGEEENQVFSNEDGREFVFDKEGNLVTNAWNKGSFNYAPYDKPVDKFLLDIFPWMIWGNAADDPTSIEERIYNYSWDLWYSVQSYIYLDDFNELEKLTYSELSKQDKQVYHLFYKIFLNDDYKIKLNKDKSELIRLREDEKYYWTFFDQIMNTLGFTPEN